jgi:glycosyltransferase involved in cell wall biosynthesis
VVSEQFARIFESRDVKPIFERSSLSPSEFVFSTEDIEAELPERLEHLTETDGKLREARAISEAFRETRSWENVAERYVELYHDVTSR